ncbi:TetR family transcriptional regulator [Desulfosarcina sp. OttesenSCG-928-A07]|nr:TetR family transcriptional regulator [Desulfosarcina sp. OttesenSCG-928-A07]
MELFAAYGIAGTMIAQIAKASGVTSAMVHYYFTNREGLLNGLVAVAERLARCMDDMWAGVAEESLADPKQIITAFADHLLDGLEWIAQLPLLWGRERLNTRELRERIFPLLPLNKVKAAPFFCGGAT